MEVKKVSTIHPESLFARARDVASDMSVFNCRWLVRNVLCGLVRCRHKNFKFTLLGILVLAPVDSPCRSLSSSIPI
jgi:hypothetical protein